MPQPFGPGSAPQNIARLDSLAAGKVSTDGVAKIVQPQHAQEVCPSYADRSVRWVTTVFDRTAMA